MRHRTYGGVRGRGRKAPPTRSELFQKAGFFRRVVSPMSGEIQNLKQEEYISPLKTILTYPKNKR